MGDKTIKVDSELLELLKSLDVRSELRAMSVRQAKIEDEIEKLNKGLTQSSSEKAYLLESVEEKKELERETGEVLIRVEEKLDVIEDRVEKLDESVGVVSDRVSDVEESFREIQDKVEGLFEEIELLKADFSSSVAVVDELQNVDAAVSDELLQVKKKLEGAEEKSDIGLEAILSLVLGKGGGFGLGGLFYGISPTPYKGEVGKPGFWEGYEIISDFGYRKRPIVGATTEHLGIDIKCPVGTPLYAPVDCNIIYSDYNAGYGHQIRGSYGDQEFMYGHLSVRYVGLGPCVKGTLVGLSGDTGVSTGPHLHLATFRNGVAYNPVDSGLEGFVFHSKNMVLSSLSDYGVGPKYSVDIVDNPLSSLMGEEKGYE